MIKSLLFTGVSCTAIGLAVGAILASSPATTSVQVERTIQQVGSQGVGRSELAVIVRQELARERAQAPVMQQPVPETPDQARERMTEDELAHADEAQQVLRAAVARGRWTLEDRSALLAQMAMLPAALQAEIGGKLAVALNTGELQMEGDWLPL